MCLADGFRGDVADLGEIPAGNIVQAVCVVIGSGNGVGVTGMGEADDGFHQVPRTLLNVLTHGVQVGGEFHGGGKNTLVVLALALTVELFPPLRHEAEAGLIAAENLNGVALAVQVLTGGGILPGGVFGAAHIERLKLTDRGGDDTADINAGNGHREQADRGENAETAADIIGNHKALPAVGVGQRLQHAAMRVGGGKDMLSCIRAVLLVEQFAEDAEGDGGLQRGAGLGNDVHVEVAAAKLLDGIAQRIGRESVADEEDLGITAAEDRTQQLNGAAGAEIGTADADDNEGLGTRTDGIRGGQNAVKFRFLDLLRQVEPAGEIRTETAAGGEYVMRSRDGCKIGTGLCKEALGAG